jgi:hypothetical protein
MTRRPTHPRLKRWLGGVGAVVLLGLVFLMYFRSQLVFDLATRWWSCF